MSELLTPSQTVGPYFSMRLPWPDGPYVVSPETPGAITILGRLYDGVGDPDPRRPDRDLAGGPERPVRAPERPARPDPRRRQGVPRFGRCATNHDGSFKIVTLKPGALPFGDGRTEAPHIDVSVFSRGMLDRSVTRIYFPDEDAANAADPVLEAVPADRRGTLIAVPGGDGLLRFDIHMQGPQETVFFDL